jgi:hypothetical protein
MFKISILSFLLIAFNFACAQSQESAECFYTNQVVQELSNPNGGKVVAEVKGMDQDSEEITYTHTIEFDNQDTASVEQKYCSMYNMSVIYKLRKLDKENFEKALNSIDEITKSVKQDYQLKAPLMAVVDMTMNQRKLSLDSAFEVGLPAQAVNSGEYVEHGIGFKRLEDDTFDAEIEFYFALGGE